jgi:hypothetical protein
LTRLAEEAITVRTPSPSDVRAAVMQGGRASVALGRELFREWKHDNASMLAAAVAFYATFRSRRCSC